MHTPGPWQIVPGVYDTNPETASEFPHGPEIVSGSTPVAYCQMYGEDDAALIAAAPKLLAAAREIDRLLLVIESAVRDAARLQWKPVVAALKANHEAIETALSSAQRQDEHEGR